MALFAFSCLISIPTQLPLPPQVPSGPLSQSCSGGSWLSHFGASTASFASPQYCFFPAGSRAKSGKGKARRCFYRGRRTVMSHRTSEIHDPISTLQSCSQQRSHIHPQVAPLHCYHRLPAAAFTVATATRTHARTHM